MNNNFAAVTAARTLKVVGIILLLSFVLDFVILLFPFQPTNRLWQIDLATNLVDRGIVPLVGLAMLFAGYWADITEDGRPSGIDLRFPALVLASLLGLIFLLIFPLHLNNVRQASVQQVDQINKQADQLETQLQNQLSLYGNQQVQTALESRRSQIKAQLTEVIKNEQQYNLIINNPQIPPAQKELLKKAKANPQDIDKLIAQQTDPQKAADQELNRIRQGKEEAEKQAKERAWKSGMRIGMSSLLLSIGYIIIGWTGLRGMGSAQGNGVRKATAR
ncbi:MAG: hypothetical protein C6Y22_10485 [Hapalosiphonaceae cyanobacterium JJU2]|nr:MAG: hypothetical protein C6Y22_10485 [Hapalosiphonaceae cyanobacterium JJU2]